MQDRTEQERTALGCGFLPPPPPAIAASVRPWDHPSREYGEDEIDDKGHPLERTCVGYLRQMPEVREVTHARLHWDKGDVHVFTEGEQPTENLLHGIVTLDVAIRAVDIWRATPASRGGGGPG